MKDSAHDVRSSHDGGTTSNVTQFRNYLLSISASKVTVKNYVSDVNHFIRWFEKDLQSNFSPDLVTKETVEYYKKINSKTLSASSLERHLSSLRKFFNFLKLEGHISYDPIPRLNKESLKESDPWSLKDFKNFLYVSNASYITIKNYINDVKQFLKWAEEVTKPKNSWKVEDQNIFHKLNNTLLLEYKERLIENRFSPRSVNRKLSSLRKYLNWLKEQGLIKARGGEVEGFPKRAASYSSEFSERALREGEPRQDPERTRIPEQSASYSPFPPLRLFQKCIGIQNFLIDALIASPIALLINSARYFSWKTKGKPVFKSFRAIRSIRNLPKAFYAPLSISLAYLPLHKKLIHHLKYTRPKWYKTYHSYSISHYLHLAILILIMSAIGFAIYDSVSPKPPPPEGQVLAALNNPPRLFSFQGRLTDASDVPITTTTDLRFGIYDADIASGSALKWQEVQTVTPDTDGVFSVLLGKKTALSQSIFTLHSGLWLGVTVGKTPELTPRQQIASVAFAQNSDLLQGLRPITETGAGTTNVILALDSSGNLVIGGTATPTFQATGGKFTLSGSVLSLTTLAGSNSNIELKPDGIGKIDLQEPLLNTSNNNNIASARGAVEIDDLFAILATSSGQSAFTLDQNGAGPIISASSSGTARFTVDNSGNTTISGNFLSALTASRDLGSSSVRWNNLWVQTINATGTNTSGQASFTYDPADTTYAQATVLINPTSAGPNELLLGTGVGGVERASFDTEGDLVIGFAGGTVTRNSNPLTVYNHGTTQVASIDTSGNLTLSGDLALNGGDLTSTGALTLTPGAGTNLNIALSTTGDFAVNTDDLYVDTSAGFVGIGTTGPTVALDVNGVIRALGGNNLALRNAANDANVLMRNVGASTIRELQIDTGVVGAVFVGNSGNVGIGDTSPTAKLDIGDSTGAFSQSEGLAIAGSSAGGAVNALLLQNKATQATGNAVYLNFGGSTDWMARVEGGFTAAGDGYLQFWTANTGTILERMRIDKDGEVGIGTIAPLFKLDVLSGTINTGTGGYGANPNGLSVTAPNMAIGASGGNILITTNSDFGIDKGGTIAFGGRDTTGSTGDVIFGQIRGAKENASSTNGDGYLSFSTVPDNTGLLAERMRILANGNVGIGNSDPTVKLDVTGSIKIRDTGCNCQILYFADSAGTAQSSILNVGGIGNGIRFAPNNSNKMTIFPGGQLYVGGADPGTTPPITLQVIGDARVGTSGTNGCVERFDGASLVGTCSSDIVFKKNIEGILSSLEKLVLLNPVTFEFKSDEFPDKGLGKGTRVFGLIAQEVEKIFPELVGVDKDGYKTVSYGVELQMLTIQSVKELYAKVKSLEDKSCVQSSSEFGLIETVCSQSTIEKLAGSGTYAVKNYLGEVVTGGQILAEAVVGTLRAGYIQAQEIAAGRIETDEFVSPVAEIARIETDTIAPLSSDKVVIRLTPNEQQLTANESEVSSPKLVVENASGSAVASIDDEGNVYTEGDISARSASFSGTVNSFGLVSESASIAGTLTAKNVIAENISSEVASIKYLVSSIKDQIASPSAHNTYYELQATESAQLAYVDTLQAEVGTFMQGLFAVGPTSLSDATVFGQLSVGASLILADNSINVLGSDLQIQPLGQGGISFLAGKVVIDTSGNLDVSGNATIRGTLFANVFSPIPGSDLVVNLASSSGRFVVQNASGSAVLSVNDKGDITASGSARFNDLVSRTFSIVREAQADTSLNETVASSSAGFAVITAGEVERTIITPFVKENSLIYITPTSDTLGQTPYIARQTIEDLTLGTQASFTIRIPKPVTNDINLNWWIVN